ncbi:MAG TPA: Maf family protein [Terriglobales bacterium]|nr:Maf family protein [Terriglobales bacterium]
MHLILASSSPRRQELLRRANLEFTVQPSDIPEDLRPGESPRDFAERLAFEKANAIFQTNRADGTVVLGADTIVVVDNEVLGKPTNATDARRMLKMISGRAHQVMTGVCLLGKGIHDVRLETTVVHVIRIPEQEIEDYIAHGEPMDKAGAYAIQGIASRWIPRVDGCFFNVVGLPVPLVYGMLRDHKLL